MQSGTAPAAAPGLARATPPAPAQVDLTGPPQTEVAQAAPVASQQEAAVVTVDLEGSVESPLTEPQRLENLVELNN